jgi:transcriptional regulator with XRE-family HTH domain
MKRPTQEDKHLATFGRKDAALRKKRGLTQDEISYKTGLSVDTIGAIEQGRRWARLTTLHKLAKALGTTTDELFRGL